MAYMSKAVRQVAQTLVPEVDEALAQWIKSTSPEHRGVLIGGVALAFYCKPRYTEDVDLFFLTVSKVPTDVPGFRKHRPSAFERTTSNVEIETVTPASFRNVSAQLARKVVDTAVEHKGLKVASIEGLICLKLAAGRFQDKADVVQILSDLLKFNKPLPSLGDWPLTVHQEHHYQNLLVEAQAEASTYAKDVLQ